MGKINVLSFAVANLIAAGEVVDRPASVIKELLENAIDSGASRITVEIQNGGVTYMRVADNGCGMEAEDLPIAIRRHATSKIKEAKDLEGILTLGFRGEALAAIASVSELRILSKTASAPVGAMLESRGGEILGITERACATGTTVIVENLFANVPARRKFLKKDVTEAMAVHAVVEKIALSKPEIAIRLMIDGTTKLDTAGDGTLKNTVYSVFGREFASKLIETALTMDGIEVHGFIGRSDNVRANRNYQNFFINGRYVKSKTAMAALEQAYVSYIPPEKFPCCVLFLNINPAAVDVNVHPAKLEVKFSNEKPVFEAIYYAVRNALEENSSRPNMVLKMPNGRNGRLEARLSDAQTPIPEGRQESLKARQITTELPVAQSKANESPKRSAPSTEESATEKNNPFWTMTAEQYVEYMIKTAQANAKSPESESSTFSSGIETPENNGKKETVSSQRDEQWEDEEWDIPVETAPVQKTEEPAPVIDKTTEVTGHAPVSESLQYRLIGEAFHSYILVEVGDKLLVIDQHAAHERILFEQLKAGMSDRNKASQMLMLPLEIMMTAEEVQLLSDFRQEIEAVGFEFAAGRHTVQVSAIPEGIPTDAVGDMLTVIADRIKHNTGSAKLTRDILFEKALYQASCKAAIKAGRQYPEGHLRWLVAKLMELPDITVCPHGRPVAMELTKKNLDHQFERT